MRALQWMLACLLAGCSSANLAQVPTTAGQAAANATAGQVGVPHADAALAGEYALAGVMETGSGLLLRSDGSFEWYFSYGALDLGARGTWARQGDGVELKVSEMGFPPQYPEMKFERMHLRIDGTALVPAWPWDMDDFQQGAEHGRYERDEP